MRLPLEIRVGPARVVEVFESELFEMAFGIDEEEVTHYCSIEAGYVALRTACAKAVREHRERQSK